MLSESQDSLFVISSHGNHLINQEEIKSFGVFLFGINTRVYVSALTLLV